MAIMGVPNYIHNIFILFSIYIIYNFIEVTRLKYITLKYTDGMFTELKKFRKIVMLTIISLLALYIPVIHRIPHIMLVILILFYIFNVITEYIKIKFYKCVYEYNGNTTKESKRQIKRLKIKSAIYLISSFFIFIAISTSLSIASQHIIGKRAIAESVKINEYKLIGINTYKDENVRNESISITYHEDSNTLEFYGINSNSDSPHKLTYNVLDKNLTIFLINPKLNSTIEEFRTYVHFQELTEVEKLFLPNYAKLGRILDTHIPIKTTIYLSNEYRQFLIDNNIPYINA